MTAAVAIFAAAPWTRIGAAQQSTTQSQQRTPGPAPTQPARDTSSTPAPGDTSSIVGRILASDTGRPVKRARVFVTAAELRGGRSAITGNDGRYEIKEIPAGRYTVSVSKTGYVTMSHGQTRPQSPATPLQVRAGEQLTVDFRLPRGSVITGRVLDEDAEPLAGAIVQVLRSQYQQGERRLQPVGTATSDDRGEYRVFGLPPGEYVVSAMAPGGLGLPVARAMAIAGPGAGGGAVFYGPGGGPGGGPPGGPGFVRAGRLDLDIDDEPSSLAPTYYPGVTDPNDAGRVGVGLTQELGGIDIALQLVPTAKVSGVVTVQSGTFGGGIVFLMPESGAGRRIVAGGSNARVGPDGSFTIPNVTPGRYTLMARSGGGRGFDNGRGGPRSDAGGDRELFGSQPVTVAGQNVNVIVSVGPGATISGSVVAEGTGAAATPNLTRVRVAIQSAESTPFGGNSAETPDASGAFTMASVPVGSAVIRATSLPSGWMLKNVTVDGRDVTDAPMMFRSGQTVSNVRVTITDRTTRLSGAVVNERGEPAIGTTVIAFSSDSSQWGPFSRRTQAARPDQAGEYLLDRLPAGEYLLVAIDDVEQGEWSDPAFLEQIRSAGVRVNLTDGDVKTQDLKPTSRR